MNNEKTIPPKFANRLLHSFLRDDLAEEVQGDLEEKFYADLKEKSIFRTKFNYWFQVFNYLRPFAIRKSRTFNPNHAMLSNQLIITYRTFLKNKIPLSINLFGMSIALGCCIAAYVNYQYNVEFDKGHVNANKIYRVAFMNESEGKLIPYGVSPMPVGELIRENFKNVNEVVRYISKDGQFRTVSAKIKNVKFNKLQDDGDRKYKPVVFLLPMSQWHLYREFKNGVNVGGRIEFVWLFGIIGTFVLLLACINFMNLSTARSERRAKEVGIRKSIGSVRAQLVSQFFSESLVVAFLAFLVSLLLVQLMLPTFNQVADKKLILPILNPLFWTAGVCFSLLTGIIAGSYPALYLSSFNPVQVLKGTFRVGRFASIPRKVLVVVQFSVSVTLIIGTIVVFNQIQYAKNRPIGYERNGLINMFLTTQDLHKHFDAVRNELKSSGAIVEMAESGSPVTQVWNSNGGFEWEGKDPALAVDFPNNGITHEYGKTIGWQFKEGRDFSHEYSTDSNAFVINEAAEKFLGFKKTVGATLTWEGKPYTIIGIIKDMVVESPYEPARASLFHISKDDGNVILMKMNPEMASREALGKIETVIKKHNPDAPFEYKFVDEDYARKFGDEERIGKLASFFAALAIFISCLGIFGLASFVAEQKAKEIGVRKVMGASVFTLWKMLSRDFVLLVTISFLIASLISFYAMNNWLLKYEYRTEISWWVFAVAGMGALVITLATVSYQAIKAALANPVTSLRTE